MSNASVMPINAHPALIDTPYSLFMTIRRNRVLITRLAMRELTARWRGSMLGMTWSFVTPLLNLAVYGFVFSTVFHSRWSGALSTTSFALILFTGLIGFSIFAECVNRSPGLVLENVSYVKKVIFPLEILPVVSLLAALVNAAFGFSILFVGALLIVGGLPWTVVMVPVVLAPYCLLILGITWVLSSLGVFLRDLRQLVSVLTSLLMFLTPVFYPLSSIPEKYRWVIMLNPLTLTLEQLRNVIFAGVLPEPGQFAISTATGLIAALLGYYLFMRTRKGFADVL
jgi:lipopolysaccharide transport system permease protein